MKEPSNYRLTAFSSSSGIRGSAVSSARMFTSTSLVLKDYPAHTLFPMPALSPTMDVGTITSWQKEEGESFIAGDSLCTIETDKASVDYEAQDDGTLAKILRRDGAAVDIAVGTPICIVVDDAEDAAAFSDYVAEEDAAPAAAESAPAPVVAPEATATASARTVDLANILMPSARHLAESKGLDATGLAGTGKGGRVTKGDVMQALIGGSLPALSKSVAAPAAAAPVAAAAPAAPVAAAAATGPIANLPVPQVDFGGDFADTPNTKMRKIIASRLTESKRDVPHFYTAMEVELDGVLALRKKLAANHDVKVSVNDFIIRCCALALRDVPEVNGTYDAKADTVRLHDSIDVSVAVATPTGLITPIVFNTDKLGLSEITDTIRDLAGRAREGKLAPAEYQGGTFSVSNLGMFGIDEFSAVINPPQAAILAVGGGSRRIVPTPYVEGAEKQAKPSIRTIMTAKLSADRRVVDEATAALFLAAFKHYITKPELLLL
jgi:pyruvate dehydrogenase E2 component (dihydrolipoamide acetyltransferase)